MSSDGEDYGDLPDDEDLEQALTQVSQSLPRLDESSSWNRNDDDDEDDGGIASRRPRRGRASVGDKHTEDRHTADEEAAEKKKSKYKIHIPKDATHFATQVVYGTQPEEPSSSPPYRARGAIWKMPKPKQPEPPRKEAPVRFLVSFQFCSDFSNGTRHFESSQCSGTTSLVVLFLKKPLWYLLYQSFGQYLCTCVYLH